MLRRQPLYDRAARSGGRPPHQSQVVWVSWVFVLTIYSVTSVRATGNVPVQAVLWGVALGTLFEMVTLPTIGHLWDALGRKSILVAGAVLSIMMAYPVLSALGSTSAVTVAGALALALNVGHGIMFAAEATAAPSSSKRGSGTRARPSLIRWRPP